MEVVETEDLEMGVAGAEASEEHHSGLRASLLSPTPDMSQSLNQLIRMNYSQVFPEALENLKPVDRDPTPTGSTDETDAPIEPLPPLRSIFGDFLPQRGASPKTTDRFHSNSSPAPPFLPLSPAPESLRPSSASPSPVPAPTFSTQPPAYLSQMTSAPSRVNSTRAMSTDSLRRNNNSSSGTSPQSPSSSFSASDSASFLSLLRASTEDDCSPPPRTLSSKPSNKINHTFFSDPCHPSLPSSDGDDPMGDSMNDSEHASGRGPRVCCVCGTNSTPRWRRGPRGRQTLCNSCGLKFIRKKKKEMKSRGD